MVETRPFTVESLFASRTSAVPARIGGLGNAPNTDIIRFGGGIPAAETYPLATFAELFPLAIAEDNFAAFTYGGAAGHEGLRKAIAKHMNQRDNLDLTEQNISIVNGIAGGLGVIASAFINPGDVVLAEEASFPGSIFTWRISGAKVVPAPIDEHGLDIDAVAEIVRSLKASGETIKAIYTISNFQNPTGSTLGEDRRRQLVELARQNDFLIVQDDAYGDIRFVDSMPPSLLALAPEHAIEVGTFSKTIAPGLRIGWLAGSVAISSMLVRVRTDMGTTPMLQRLVTRFMNGGHFVPHVADANSLYREKRDLLLKGLEEHCAPFATWTKPDGGFFIWVTLNEGDAAKLAEIAPEYGVAIFPGAGFHVGEPSHNTFRMSYSFMPKEEIAEGARRLGAAMRGMTA